MPTHSSNLFIFYLLWRITYHWRLTWAPLSRRLSAKLFTDKRQSLFLVAKLAIQLSLFDRGQDLPEERSGFESHLEQVISRQQFRRPNHLRRRLAHKIPH